MQPHVGLWTTVSAVALSVIAALAVWDAVRKGGRARHKLALALVLLAAVAVCVKATALTDFTYRWISVVSTLAFAGSGVALLEYRSAIAPLRVSIRVAAVLATLAAVAYALWVRFPLGPSASLTAVQMGAVVALIGVWSACVLPSAIRFWTEARHRPPVERIRLRLLAIAYGGMVGLIAIIVSLSHTLNGRTAMVPVAQAAVIAFIPFLFVGVSPPKRLQRLWLRRAARDQARTLVRVGTWYWDVANDDVHWSPDVARMLDLVDDGERHSFAWAFDRVHADDRPAADAMVRRLLDTLEPQVVEVRIVRGDRERWVEVRAQAVTDPLTDEVAALFGTVQDVSDRKEDELAVSESRRRLDEAQHLARVGSWEADLVSDTVTWSDELCRLHGLDPTASPGPFPDWYLPFVHPDDRTEVEESILALRWARTPFEIEYRVVVDGEIRWIRARGEPVRCAEGRLVALRGVCADATERRRSEEALRSAFEREREAVERLRALDDTKDALLAAVSHELRTPLAVVVGLAQTLQRDDMFGTSDTGKSLLDRLEANALRLEHLLVDLLDLDRLSRGVIEPKRRPVDLTGLAERVVDTVDSNHHPILVEGPSLVASVDPAQIERIVENLVINATRHTPTGTRIIVRCDGTDDGAVVTVTDEGSGVPDEIKDEIFAPFRQGPSSAAGGTGIGLSLVARFAELHGGRAWVEDNPTGGARFCVLLPTPDRSFEITPREVASRDQSSSLSSRFS